MMKTSFSGRAETGAMPDVVFCKALNRSEFPASVFVERFETC